MLARLVDIHQRRIYPAEITVEGGRIRSIRETDNAPAGAGYLLPGFTDAHVHIESSMLTPAEFGRMAVVHGTVATVSDPHEIANVLGAEGVAFMLDNAALTPLKCCFGAPSCVPATGFETAGATLDAAAVEKLLANPAIGYLSEMMNFPGVLHGDPQCLAKIAAAQRVGKPVDGHAPGLRGAAAQQYFAAGISTDHECFTYPEGQEKARLGVKILIREGSAARNFEALWPLLNEFPEQVMFCSDDKHPDDLLHGHIDRLVARAVAHGCDLFNVLRAACLNPVEHYRLPVGLLRAGDPADFICVADLTSFRVLDTWIDGQKVAENGRSLLPHRPAATPNRFLAHPKSPSDFQLLTATATVSGQTTLSRQTAGATVSGQTTLSRQTAGATVSGQTTLSRQTAGATVSGQTTSSRQTAGATVSGQTTSSRQTAGVRVIEALDGQIVTEATEASLPVAGGCILPDPGRDILKITVVNRYAPDARPAIGFVRGFGLRHGALASTVAHDSHNIVAVGTDDAALCAAVNAVIEARGGIGATDGNGDTRVLPLPIAGLMSPGDGYALAEAYARLDAWTKDTLNCSLQAPFMVLSFLALPVIPKLKMTDLGLFDGERFDFVPVEIS